MRITKETKILGYRVESNMPAGSRTLEKLYYLSERTLVVYRAYQWIAYLPGFYKRQFNNLHSKLNLGTSIIVDCPLLLSQ